MSERRTAIVTGGARGIGRAIAERLAHDGMDIAILDLDPSACEAAAKEIASDSVRAIGVGVDVSNAASVATAVEDVVQRLSAPTVLINNAGILRDNLLFKMTEDDWEAVMGVHLRGAFLMARATQKFMVDARFGRIVNLSSSSALGNRGQANYSAAKAGLQGFTKTLAIELGPFGVTANAIAPGFIVTAMTEATAQRMGITFDQLKERGAASTSVRRVGAPEDVAAAASFFASDDASFISGQVLYVAGGPLG